MKPYNMAQAPPSSNDDHRIFHNRSSKSMSSENYSEGDEMRKRIMMTDENEDEPYDPRTQQPNTVAAAEESEDLFRFYQPLHDAALNGNWDNARRFLTENPDADITQVNQNGMTILHVAANMGHTVFIKKLVRSRALPKATMKMRDAFGWTALHYAAVLGSLSGVEVLVSTDNSLIQVPDSAGSSPLKLAILYAANKRVIWYLIKNITNYSFSGVTGAHLINALVAAGYYDICLYLLNQYPHLAKDSVDNWREDYDCDLFHSLVLSSEFPSGSRLSFWEKCIYYFIPIESPIQRHSEAQLQQSSTIRSMDALKHWIFGAASKAVVYVPSFKHIIDIKFKHKCIMEVLEITCKTMSQWNANDVMTYFRERETECMAAKLGRVEAIRALIKHIPYFMDYYYTQANMLVLAVKNRQEHVFNLMMERGVTIKLLPPYANEETRETILHVAAKLAPYTRLTSVSSPALQMQRELQWFQGVEKFVRPTMKKYRNKKGKTPRELFTTKHKKLAEAAEKWLKDTANSCLVVATLIITVVFAAAFTIPGGNIDGIGIPLFLYRGDFMIFIVSDAVGMFSSATSILMFLSILTARYAEDDFLRALPKRLILGLVSLLIALASMMVDFGIALFMIVHPRFKWIVFPIIGLTYVPVGLFIWLQLPLFIFMVRSTYGPCILKPRRISK